MEIVFVLIFFAGLAAGFINVIAGGGSMLTLPLLISAGLEGGVANGTNRIAILAQNIFAIQGFKSKGYKISKFHLLLGAAATFGAIIGSSIALDTNDELFNRILAILLVAFILYSLFKPKFENNLYLEDISTKSQWKTSIVFFFIGIYGGFIQAGVGLIIMGALSLMNRLKIHSINSIKVVVVACYTIFALANFIYHDKISWLHGLLLAAGNATGGYLAGKYSHSIPEPIVKKLVLVITLGLAVKLWFF